MANMEERLQAVVSQAETDGYLWHTIIHGNNTTTVSTENGKIPSVSKQLNDVRNELINGAADYLGSCLQAKNETSAVLDNALVIKSEIEQLKSDTQEFRNTAENYKNMAQTTFNSVSTAVSQGISNIQIEGTTQIANVKSAAIEEVAEATAQAERAENATSSKLDISLSNISKTSIIQLMRWLCPNWSKKTILSLNTDVTISQIGWVLMRNTVYNSNITGYINGVTVFRQYGSYGNWEEYNSLSFLVDVGDVVKLTAGELTFIPCKGS